MNDIATRWLPACVVGDGLLAFDTTALQSAARPLSKDLYNALVAEGSTDLLLSSERSRPLEERRRLQRQRSRRAWGARWGHATPTYAQPRESIGGWHIHTTVAVGWPGQLPRPARLLAAIAITPASGYSAGAMLAEIDSYVEARWQRLFELVADRDYSKNLAVWQDLRASGRRFVFDLNAAQLQPRGAYKGAIILQGMPYCPATPPSMWNPGPRPPAQDKGQPSARRGAWVGLNARRSVYQAIIRSVRPNGLNVSCPHGRTVQCALRAELDPALPLPIVVNHPEPGAAPPICKQTTVLIPDKVNPLRQTYRWGLRTWERPFSLGRAAIEGVHGETKGPWQLGLSRWISNSNRIDVIGLLVALVAALYNLESIRRWVRDNPECAIARDLADDLLFSTDDEAYAWLNRELRNGHL